MENEKKVIDLPETENEEVEVVDEGKMAKAKNFIKKHGKKVAAFAGLATVGLIGYAIGHRNSDGTYSTDETVDGEYTILEDIDEE